jgi:hypothetical protein
MNFCFAFFDLKFAQDIFKSSSISFLYTCTNGAKYVSNDENA